MRSGRNSEDLYFYVLFRSYIVSMYIAAVQLCGGGGGETTSKTEGKREFGSCQHMNGV